VILAHQLHLSLKKNENTVLLIDEEILVDHDQRREKMTKIDRPIGEEIVVLLKINNDDRPPRNVPPRNARREGPSLPKESLPKESLLKESPPKESLLKESLPELILIDTKDLALLIIKHVLIERNLLQRVRI